MTTPSDGQPWAVITGASGGIGLDLARGLAARGHRLFLVARSADKLRAAAEHLAATYGVTTVVHVADLAEPGAPASLCAALDAAGIAPAVLVNNAGVGAFGPFLDASLPETMAMIQLNVSALTELTGRIVPGMLLRGGGRVLQVASTGAFQPGPLLAVYYATKAYVLSFSEALGNELAGTGVTVTTLCPGPTRTDFQVRAKLSGGQRLRGLLMMDPAVVAEAGLTGMFAGRARVIPGLVNKLTAVAPRFVPRGAMTALVRFTQERDGGRGPVRLVQKR